MTVTLIIVREKLSDDQFGQMNLILLSCSTFSDAV